MILSLFGILGSTSSYADEYYPPQYIPVNDEYHHYYPITFVVYQLQDDYLVDIGHFYNRDDAIDYARTYANSEVVNFKIDRVIWDNFYHPVYWVHHYDWNRYHQGHRDEWQRYHDGWHR